MNKHRVFENEDCTIYVENEISGYLSGAFFHVDIHNWSVSKVKKHREILAHLINRLRAYGINDFYAIAPSPFEEKLIKMFGFEDTGLLFNGYKLMRSA